MSLFFSLSGLYDNAHSSCLAIGLQYLRQIHGIHILSMMTTPLISIYVVFFLHWSNDACPSNMSIISISKFQASHLCCSLSRYEKAWKLWSRVWEFFSLREKISFYSHSWPFSMIGYPKILIKRILREKKYYASSFALSWRYIWVLDFSAVDYLNSRQLVVALCALFSYWISHHLTFSTNDHLSCSLGYYFDCWYYRMIIVTLSTCKHLDRRELPSSNERDPHPSFTLLLVTCGRSLSY